MSSLALPNVSEAKSSLFRRLFEAFVFGQYCSSLARLSDGELKNMGITHRSQILAFVEKQLAK